MALNNLEKLEFILKTSEELGITAYEFGKNTDISSVGTHDILTGKSKNPRTRNLNAMLAYIELKYNKSIEINIKDKKPLLLREFGIKRISTKDLIKTDNTIKRDGERIKIFKNLPDNIDIRVNINGRIKVKFSEEFMDMNINFTKIIKSGSNINDVIKDYVNNELFRNSNYEIEIDMSQIKVHRNNQGGQFMKLEDMILRDEQPPSIRNLYSDVIENTNTDGSLSEFKMRYFDIHGLMFNVSYPTPSVVINFIKEQITTSEEDFSNYDWDSRTSRQHNIEIRKYYGFKKFNSSDYQRISNYLYKNIIIINNCQRSAQKNRLIRAVKI